MDEVEFRIQIASSSQKVSDKYGVLALFDDIWVYEENNMYKYTTAISNSYQEISEILKKVRMDVADCFIVAFKDGERIPVSSTH